jgi:hypothetical protein
MGRLILIGVAAFATSLTPDIPLAAVVPPDLRCSVLTLRNNPEGYFWPLENIRGFVAQAEVIARVIATDSVSWPGQLSTGDIHNRGALGVRFRTVENLRGQIPGAAFVLPGRFVPQDDYNAMPVPYRMVRGSGTWGDCFAREYKRGAEYLMLLRPSPAGLTPHWAALAPLNEQIRGAEDPWLLWVRAAMRVGG